MKLVRKSNFAFATALIFLASVGCSNTGSNRASNAPAGEPGAPGAADRGTAADRAPTTAPANLTAADRDFAIKAVQGGMAEVDMGNLAQQQGSSAAVKDLGKKLVDDHTKANNDVKEIAAREGITLPTELDSKHRKTIDRVSKLSGAQFDRELLKEVVRDHRDDVSEFQKQIDRGSDPALKNFASNYLPVIQDHLNMAQSAQGSQTTQR